MALIKLKIKSLGSFDGFATDGGSSSKTIILDGVDVSYNSSTEQVTVLDV